MRTIKIYIYDSDNEELGIKAKHKLVDLHFNENAVIGYWIDPDIDPRTGSIDVIFYIGYTSFRSPATERNMALLNSCMSVSLIHN